MPNYNLNQCWDIVNWSMNNKFQWNLMRNLFILSFSIFLGFSGLKTLWLPCINYWLAMLYRLIQNENAYSFLIYFHSHLLSIITETVLVRIFTMLHKIWCDDNDINVILEFSALYIPYPLYCTYCICTYQYIMCFKWFDWCGHRLLIQSLMLQNTYIRIFVVHSIDKRK